MATFGWPFGAAILDFKLYKVSSVIYILDAITYIKVFLSLLTCNFHDKKVDCKTTNFGGHLGRHLGCLL